MADLKISFRVEPCLPLLRKDSGKTHYMIVRTLEKGGMTLTDHPAADLPSAQFAYDTAYAWCKLEHEALGYPPGDERVQYPTMPTEAVAA